MQGSTTPEHSYTFSNCVGEKKSILLPTAMVYLRGADNQLFPCKAILDSGSHLSFIRQRLANKLPLKKSKINASISGLGEITLRVKQKVNTVIQNKNGDFSTPLELLIVPYITTSIHRMDATKVNIPSNIDLTDKDFDIPGEIDMLIGCELFFELLRPNKFRSPCEKWLFQETVFGYIVVGSFDKFEEKSYCGLAINAEINSDNLNQQLQAFWEIEKVDESSIEYSLEELIETQYQTTHYRTEEGRYVVQLPLKKDPYCLGNSRFLAEVRLNQLWKKLSKHYELQTLYKSFLREYIDLNHMQLVADPLETNISYFLPHHGVFRPIVQLPSLE
ncbi:DUF1758 domain-containing protein [Trichonephila clavipes]|nr:DUF1758 domain-containing protein [Trichonephila clavipes]